jgi:hypothetical protein
VAQRSEEAHQRLLEEIAAEKAAVLRRVASGLEARLEELRRLLGAIGAGTGDRAALVERFNEARNDARLRRWYLEVQRKAIGLRRHELLDELYSVPAPIRD